MNRTCLALVLAIPVIGIAVAIAGEDWAQERWANWRGPQVNGYAPGADPPTEWSEKENIRWRVKLPGPGHATPVVWHDRIYVLSAVRAEKTGASQMHRFVVSALDRKTGRTIWETVVREEVPHEPGHLTASQASASPVTDGEHVWAFFGSRGLYCLDKNGKVKWERDLGRMRTRNEFGEGASPALHGDTIVVQWDHEGDSFITAFDKLTGEQLWKVPRNEPTSWTTPVVVEDGERTLVVAGGTNRVRAYDLKTGDEVWSCAGLGLNVIPTPIVDSGLIFVMSGYRDPAAMAIRYPGARGDITDSAVVWRIDRGVPYVPSPLLHDGKLYFLERFKAMLASYELKTGKVVYEQQRLNGLGNIYASLVGAQDRVYVLDRDGNTLVFRAGKKFKVLAQNELNDAFDASPVIVGNEIYLRGHEYLYAIADTD